MNPFVAGNRHVVVVRTVATSPATVLTFGDIKFRSIALNVVQPDWSTPGAVRVTNKLSAVSARIVVNDD